MNLVRVEQLSRTYHLGSTAVYALSNVSLTIDPGECVALMGPSGSGKSTLMHLLGCLDRPTSGRYFFEGRDVSRLQASERARLRNRRIGFIFQSFNLLPRLTALQNVALPLLYGDRARNAPSDPQAPARKALARVGLADRADHRPTQLSGGQQQRVAIARALVADPLLILADEPTGNLDSASGAHIMEELVRLSQAGQAVVVVTHDAQVAAYAHRIVHLRDGQLVEPEAP